MTRRLLAAAPAAFVLGTALAACAGGGRNAATARPVVAPSGAITRGEFARRLVEANNRLWFDEPGKQIRPSNYGAQAFPDVPPSHADYAYLQALAAAGYATAFADGTFRPDAPLTREEMLALKEAVDRGGVDRYYENAWRANVPYRDAAALGPRYRGAIAEDAALDRYARAHGTPALALDNVRRAFGSGATLRPQQPVTPAQAGRVLGKIGGHTPNVVTLAPGDAPRGR